jgi:hypothetical protein
MIYAVCFVRSAKGGAAGNGPRPLKFEVGFEFRRPVGLPAPAFNFNLDAQALGEPVGLTAAARGVLNLAYRGI